MQASASEWKGQDPPNPWDETKALMGHGWEARVVAVVHVDLRAALAMDPKLMQSLQSALLKCLIPAG